MKNRLIALLALAFFSLAACTEREPEGSNPGKNKSQNAPAMQDTMPRDNTGNGSSPGGGQ